MSDDCRTSCIIWCMIGGGIILFLSIMFLVAGDWVDRGEIRRKNGPVEHCYGFQWLIEFQDGTEAESLINGYTHCRAYDHPDDISLQPMNPYKIGRTYPCYHSTSHRSETLQLAEPAKRWAGRALIVGGIMLLLSGGLVVMSIVYLCVVSNRSSDQKTQRGATAVKVVSIEEENAPLSPLHSCATTPAYELDKKSTAV